MRKIYSLVKSLIVFTLIFIIANSTVGQIAVRSYSNSYSSSNTFTINTPTGVVAGDVMFLDIDKYPNNTSPTLSGWTLVSGPASLGGSNYGYILYKVVTATEPGSYTFNIGTNSFAAGSIFAFSGVDATGGYLVGGGLGGPFDVAPGSISAATTTTLPVTSIITNTANAAVIMFGMNGTTSVNSFTNWTTVSPGALTEINDYNHFGYIDIGAAWLTKTTPGTTGTSSLKLSGTSNVGGILIALRPKPTNTITTSTISPSTYCVGTSSATVSVPFTSSGTFNSGNIYTAELSTATGTFPGTSIGTLASTANSGTTITATVPAGTTAGSLYRIRVTSNNPATTGTNNGTNIILSNPVAPTGTSPQIFCSSPTPTVANLTTATGNGIQWYAAASGGSALSGSTVLANGTHYYASQTVSGCEGQTRLDVTVTLNTAPSVTASPSLATQNLCLNATSTALIVTATGTGLHYQWYSNTTQTNSGGTAVGTDLASYQPLTTTAGTLYYYCIVTGTCTPGATSNASGAVVVNPKPVAGAITGATGICIGSNTTLTPNATGTGLLTYTWNSSVPVTATVSNAGLVNGVSAGTTNITYTVTDPNGCSATSAVFAFGVTPTASAITGAGGTCAGNTAALTPHATGVGTLNYVWNSTNSAVATVDNTGLVTALGLGSTTITYTVTDGNSCSATSAGFTFNVTVPTANAITAASNSVCIGNTLALTSHATGTPTLTYSWVSSNPGVATVSGTAAATTLTSVSAGSTDITYTVKDGNGCTATSVTFTVTVNPKPTAGAISGGSTLCQSSSITLTANPTGTVPFTYTWNSSSSGVASVTNAGVVTSGTTNGATNITYAVTDGNGCSATSAIFPVTVSKPTAGAITGNAAVCIGSTINLSSAGSGTGTLTYSWNSTNPGVATVSATGIVTGVATGSTNITYIVTDGNSCSAISAVKAIAVTIPTAGAITAASSGVCIGSTLTLTSHGTGTGTLTYSWLSSNPGVATVSGTAAITTLSPVSAGSTNITYTVKDGNGCTATSVTFTVTINALPTAGNITGPNIVCINGSTITLTPNATGTGPFTYTWSSSITGVATVTNAGVVTAKGAGTTNIRYTVTDANGCTSATSANFAVTVTQPIANAITQASNLSSVCMNSTLQLTSNATSVTGTPVYAWLSSNTAVATVDNNGVVTGVTAGTTNITYTVTDANGCVSAISPNYAVTVVQIPTGTFTSTPATSPTTATICAGGSITFTAPAGYPSYIFKVGGASVQTGGSNTYSTTILTTGASVTVDVANSQSCGTTFGPIVVTVNPLPTPTLSVNPTGPICQGTSVTFTAGGGTNYTFKVNGSAVLSNTTGIYTTTGLNNGDVVTVDVTDGNSCTATSAAITMAVNSLPAPTLISNPSPAVICAGSNITFTAGGGTTYEFKVNGTTVQGPNTTNTFSSTAITNAQIFTVVVTNGSGCIATSGAIPVTVNALPVVSVTTTENSGSAPNDNKICSGGTVTFTATPGFTSYKFYLRGAGSPLASVGNVYTSSTLVDGDYVTVVATNNKGCSNATPAISATITVVASPSGTLTVSPSNTICAGDNATFTATSGFTNYNFKINGTSAQNGFSNTFASTGITNGQTVTVDVTNSNGCVTTFNAIAMTVNALPTGTLSMSETSGLVNDDGIICTGAPITFTAPTGFSNYNFLLNGASIQAGSSNVYTTSSLHDKDTVTVTVTNGSGCVALLNKIGITVNPLPAVAAISVPSGVCVGKTISVTDATGSGTWSSVDPSIATVDASGNVTGVAAGTATINYTVTNANGCSTTKSASVIVYALPVVLSITGNLSVCVSSTTTLSDATPGGTWTSDNLGVATIDATSGIVSGVSAGTAHITYTVTNVNGCVQTVTETVTVNALPVVAPITVNAPATTFEVCVGNTITLSSSPAAGTWSSSATGIATINASTGVVTGVADGTATISYTVKDVNGCSTTVTQVVTVHALPVPTLSGPNPICPGATDTYTTEAGQSNYVWTFTGGTLVSGGSSTDNTITIKWDQPGTRTIHVNYTNSNGCSGAVSATVNTSTGTVPTLLPNPAPSVCLNSDGTYTAQSGFTNYTWSVTGGAITGGGTPTDNTATVTWNTVGNQSVSINFTDGSGCVAITPTVLPVTVNPLPIVTTHDQTICSPSTVDLTVAGVTSGSTAGLTYTYWTDAAATNPVATPASVGAGTYYIKGTTGSGCFTIQSVNVIVNPSPTVTITNPVAVCSPATIDLTAAGITAGSTPSLTFTYWTNAGATSAYATPATAGAGTYYIKGTTGLGCYDIQPVTVTVNPTPTIVITNPVAVCSPGTVDLTANAVTAGSTAGLIFTYFTDAGGTTTLSNPNAVATSGTYYIKGTTAAGCSDVIKPVTVVINPLPTLVINNPAAVCAPSTVDLTAAAVTSGSTPSLTYTYYTDAAGTTTLASSNAVATSGTYYIKGTTAAGCSDVIKPVTVVINPLPTLVINNPAAVCAPSTVDLTAAAVTSGSTPSLTYTYYTDAAGTTTLASPNAVATSGTYYIKGTSAAGCSGAIKPVIVNINPLPTATISGTVSVCQNSLPQPVITFTGANGTAPYIFTYNIGGGPLTVTSVGNTATVNAATTTVGVYTYTLVSVQNATCSQNQSGSAVVTVNAPPTISVTPATTTLCLGNIQALVASSTGSAPTQTAPFTSGTISVDIPDSRSRGRYGEVSTSLNISGIPATAVITNISINLNITHNYIGDLNINIKGHNGSILNLISREGGSGHNFTNTTIASSIPPSGGLNLPTNGAPYTGTYLPDGANNIGPAGNRSNVSSFSNLASNPNGNWTLYLEDANDNNIDGTLTSWSITIQYNVPVSNPVTWSPQTDLYTDAGATTAYTGQPLTTVYAMPSTSGTKVYTAMATNASGCTATAQSTLTVDPLPVVTISANYCSVPGKVSLTAHYTPGSTILWSTGQTTDSIAVDEAGTYSVTATSPGGCKGNAIIDVSTELVTNGNFDSTYAGFTSAYVRATPWNGDCGQPLSPTGLMQEGKYDVRTDGQLTHCNFWGYDHTTGNGNYMLVNGAGTSFQVWQETVSVLPNTTYYFSAWGRSLNTAGPFAMLQFNVNGAQVGTIDTLKSFDHTTGNTSWTRFYGTLTTGPTTTTALISITDLQTALGGNDFGLDDISFGTLSTFIFLESPVGTDAQTVCANDTLATIVYSVGNGNASGPTITGLPAGVKSVFTGSTLTISGIPTVAPGTYTYTITTVGCNPQTATGTITVQAQTLTLSSGNANPTQCKTAPVSIGFTLGGTAGDAAVTGLPVNVIGAKSGNTYTISGTPNDTAGVYHYTIITTGSGCNPDTVKGTITLQEQIITHISGDSLQTHCINVPIDNIQYTISGPGSLSGTVTGLPGGVTYNYTSGILIISGTPNVAGTFKYYVIGSGGCADAKDSGVITVTPAATLVLTSGAGSNGQTVCINSPITDITYSVNNATGATVTDLPDGVTGSVTGGVLTITGTPTEAGTFHYTITTSDGCGTATATGTITVQSQTIDLTTGGASPTLCQNTPMTPIIFTIGGTTPSATLSGQPAGVTGLQVGNIFTISGTPTVPGSFSYTVTVTGSCATNAIATGIITVQDAVAGGNIQLVSTAVCEGASASMTLMGQVGTIVGWETSVDGGATWSGPNGNTTISEIPLNVLVPTLWRVEVTNGCGTKYSATATVNIHNLWTGGANTDWNTGSNWSDGLVPSNAFCPTVKVPVVAINKYPILSTGSLATITNLQIDANASVTVTGNTIQIAGTITNNGIFDVTDGTVELNGTATQNIDGNNFANVIPGQNNTVKNLIISNNVNVANTANHTLNITGTLSFGPAATTAQLQTGDNITLKSSATETANVGVIANGNTITGDVTVERYSKAIQNWQFLAIPTNTSQTIHDAWQEGQAQKVVGTPGYGTQITGPVADPTLDFVSPNPSMKYWDNATQAFINITRTNIQFPNSISSALNTRNGFFLFIRGDRQATGVLATPHDPTVMRTKGSLFTGDISFTVPGNAFYSIGNPYASRVNFGNITNTAGIKAFYVWDPLIYGERGAGGYQTLSFITDYVPTVPTMYYPTTPVAPYPSYPYLESGQAAFVNNTTGSGITLTFNESDKLNGSNLVFRGGDASASRFLRTFLYSASGKVADGNAVVFNSNYQNRLDPNDAVKISNSGENLGLKRDGIILAIEARGPVSATDTIYFSLKNIAKTTYRFQFNPENMQDAGVTAFLVDNYLKTRTEVSLAGITSVNFTADANAGSYAADRFMIVFKKAAPLPVTFVSIKAAQKDKDIVVNWNMANENNMLQYDVEKSLDGNNFVKVATVAANNTAAGNYQWIDGNATPGNNYYRIKSVDKSQKIVYSTTVNVLITNLKTGITIYPNPITDAIIHLQFINQPQGKYRIRLLDPLGQLILAKQIEYAGGNGSEEIKWNYKMARGIYELEITREDGSVVIIKVLY